MARWSVWLFLSLAVLFGPLILVRQNSNVVIFSASLAGRVIAVDPGHGGVDPGALGPDGLLEKDIVLDVALRLRTLLQAAGASVVMTRETDTDLSDSALGRQYSRRKRQDLERRVRIVNESKAEILVSIHVNSMVSARWSGAQAFFAEGSDEGQKLAQNLQEALREYLKNTNRQVARGDFYMLRQSNCPAVLVEVGFISNPREASLLASEEYRRQLAWAIFAGILRYWQR
ncbi:MAG: N-acetylmuramoyl-L-alanine amidase CwlD [Peptococcaceae bacterium]|nr:N-acetylmuramoyl-L-alanine amidase CwlD [Peptococcaceae bacterium]